MFPAIISPVLMPIPMSSSTRPSTAQRRLSSLQFVDHLQGGLHRVIGVIGVVERGPEERHDHVADELVDRAAMGETTISTIRVKYWFSCRTRSSASPLSDSVVKPRMSEKSTVISRRSPPSAASVGLASSCW